jgi:hypothetical protein
MKPYEMSTHDRSIGRAASFNVSHALRALLLVVLACAQSPVTNANGGPPPATSTDVLTHFESFILTNCVPCVREVYHIATVPVASSKAPNVPGVVAPATGPSARPGEIRFEVLRAYPVGMVSRQHLVMRVVLSVGMSSEGQLYPIGVGWLDEDEVPALEAALLQMERSTVIGATDASMALVDVEFHVDSVRMGTVRTGNQTLAYVQVAPPDLPRFSLKQVWELPALYLPSSEISTLAKVVGQVNAKIRALRRID